MTMRIISLLVAHDIYNQDDKMVTTFKIVNKAVYFHGRPIDLQNHGRAFLISILISCMHDNEEDRESNVGILENVDILENGNGEDKTISSLIITQ